MQKTRTRASERVRALFADQLNDELEKEATELIRKRRVLDFLIQTGRVSAKVHDEQSRPGRVEVLFPQFSDEKWDELFNLFSQQAYFIAKFLIGKVPSKMEEAFESQGLELIPSSLEGIRIRYNGNDIKELDPASTAVLLKLFEKLDSEPFSIIVLRGRGRDETISELQRLRTLLREKKNFKSEISYQDVAYQPAPPLTTTVDRFWSSSKDLNTLEYNLRADELPASILKWLDPLPLNGLEEHVDYLLEEAYEKVARLAQGYGLGLRG